MKEPIEGQIKLLQADLDSASAQLVELSVSDDVELSAAVQRVRHIVGVIQRRLSTSDPMLLTRSGLRSLRAPTHQLSAELPGFQRTPTRQVFASIEAQCELMVAAASGLLALLT